MLRKLWKYEYRSTARMMWILVACLCGVIALTGAMVFFSSRFFAARNTLLSEELQGLLGGCTALIALFLFYIITAGSIYALYSFLSGSIRMLQRIGRISISQRPQRGRRSFPQSCSAGISGSF